MATITERLKKQKSLHQQHDYVWAFDEHSYAADHFTQKDLKIRDLHEIDHGLPKSDLRILFKILKKDYADCGRKRGAILRYIKHYREVEESKKSPLCASKLYRQLTNTRNLR